MSLSVQYTDTFEFTFRVLVMFIEENWGEKVTNQFILQTEKIIRLIATYPKMYKSSTFDSDVRVAPINKLSSLFYAVSDDYVTLLYIVDNRQEPFW
ncbi:type II toxin-antitoxin system RelE/ParE family toxin [Sphingobacterium hungaricum]